MSVETRTRVICDSCGSVLEGKLVTVTTMGSSQSYWGCKDKMSELGWVTLQRYGPAKHFCKSCADGPVLKKHSVKFKETL